MGGDSFLEFSNKSSLEPVAQDFKKKRRSKMANFHPKKKKKRDIALAKSGYKQGMN
jgi:hypothetical protein